MTAVWRALCVALVMLLASASTRAFGQGRNQRRACPPETVRWTAACAARYSLALTVRDCPDQRAVFALKLADQSTVVQIEVSSRPEGFRTARGFGISPVAQYDDWNQAPTALQAGFDQFVKCVENDGALRTGQPDPVSRPQWEGNQASPGITSPAREGVRNEVSSGATWPWRLALAGALCLAMLAIFLRDATRASTRTLVRNALPFLALPLCTWLLRRVSVDVSYFHQNGQGPLWIDYALGLPSPYGSGMREMFGAVVSRAADPDGALFLAQSVLASLGPTCAWVIARRASGSALFAWMCAIVVMFDPVLARISRTETYFSTCGALTLLAAAVLAGGSTRVRVRDPAFLLGALSAGLILSQSARIHPVGWVPASLVPLVLLAGPGRLRRRLVLTAAGFTVVGLTIAVLTLPSMLATLRGELGQKWAGPNAEQGPRFSLHPTYLLLRRVAPVALVLAGIAQRRMRAALIAATAVVVVVIASVTNKLGQLPDHYGLAYAWLHAPVAIACTAALCTRIARRRVHGLVLAGAGVAAVTIFDATRFRALTATATDQLEQAQMRAWKPRLPDGSAVMYLGESGRRRLFLPLYPRAKSGRAYPQSVGAAAMTEGVIVPWQHLFYYRSSLCSTPDGRPACDAFERAHKLAPLEQSSVTARASMTGLDYDVASVKVGLFRVEQ